MLFVEILRYITGYAEFTGTGGFSERFINLCSVHDIPLWSITYHNGYFTACTSIDGYLRISICARNSGVKVKKRRSVGLPFVIKRLRPKFGLAIGVLFFVICLSLLSNRVWVIEINGNDTIAKDIILAATQNAGLKIGKKTDELNVVRLSLDTCEAVEGISWAAIRVNGCSVYIDITPANKSPEIENKDGAFNLVSAKDAQLVILEPYRGTLQAKVFNSVMKGDVLISGFALNKDESVSLVHASGYAVGKTETDFCSSVQSNLVCTEYKSLKKTATIHFFSLNIPIGKKSAKYDQTFEKSKMITYGNKILPIGITVRTDYSANKKNKSISPQEAKLISMSKFMNEFSDFAKGKQIITADTSLSVSNDSAKTSGHFICYENIGKEVPLETEITAEE